MKILVGVLALLVGVCPPALGVDIGSDSRNPATVRAFRKVNACPSTGLFKGVCPDQVVDHKYPLCAGGKDTVENMMWQQRNESYIKDRLERELCACKKYKL